MQCLVKTVVAPTCLWLMTVLSFDDVLALFHREHSLVISRMAVVAMRAKELVLACDVLVLFAQRGHLVLARCQHLIDVR